MVKVRIWGSLQSATDDRAEVEIDAGTLRELLDGLAREYPALRPQLERGVSVAIDGKVYNDSWFTPISPDSEVVLLARLRGG
ncbi:MoaD/ThiS family protein [Roseovarius amoyensis]|uniref:MoaD/ThiS family protein n=1 Tax=Roseovarius amoyensis TaxID=2211448 RepID=UPI000DBE12EF|nr:MoaD/ThiS family protein [Roseovarius amoyensis]